MGKHGQYMLNLRPEHIHKGIIYIFTAVNFLFSFIVHSAYIVFGTVSSKDNNGNPKVSELETCIASHQATLWRRRRFCTGSAFRKLKCDIF